MGVVTGELNPGGYDGNLAATDTVAAAVAGRYVQYCKSFVSVHQQCQHQLNAWTAKRTTRPHPTEFYPLQYTTLCDSVMCPIAGKLVTFSY